MIWKWHEQMDLKCLLYYTTYEKGRHTFPFMIVGRPAGVEPASKFYVSLNFPMLSPVFAV